jgi:alpha-glucosidase
LNLFWRNGLFKYQVLIDNCKVDVIMIKLQRNSNCYAVRLINGFSILLIFLTFLVFSGCSESQEHLIRSPDGRIQVKIVNREGEIYYSVNNNDRKVLLDSKVGLQFRNRKALDSDLRIISSEDTSYSETWEQPWGERRFIENNYHQLTLHIEQRKSGDRRFDLVFRVFNDGLGFRYEIPEQKSIDSLIITNEETEFRLPEVCNAWWIPAYKEKFYESLYRHTPVNRMDTVCTPLVIELSDSLIIAIHEANLTDYAAMNLFCKDSSTLTCDLTPWSTGEKVKGKAPMRTPWRTVIIGEKPGDLITSYLMLNLNEPSKIDDTSWIKPGRYIGIWWGMHQEKYTWSQGPKHGATTANAIRYIDFAAAHNFSGVLIEGWNYGWDGDWTVNGDQFSFTKPYPDFDIKKITDYAKSKHVKLIGHNETGGATLNYEKQLDSAFAFYNRYGVDVVKTGYVSNRLDGKEYHSSQYGVRHYRKVIETAAKYHIMIDNHEPVIPTGLCRTWPNFMTSEGVRGQEWDAWSTDGGNPPDHTTIVPFVRGLAGPMDFTFGTFSFKNPVHPNTFVHTTIAKQVALYMIIYSPLQMASDLPENYTDNEAFKFICSVPVDWEDTRVLDAKIGDYVVIARKDRNSNDWYLGAITDENPRELTVNLSFLTCDHAYKAIIISDGKEAHYDTYPSQFKFNEKLVKSDEKLYLHLAPGGGEAVHFVLQGK